MKPNEYVIVARNAPSSQVVGKIIEVHARAVLLRRSQTKQAEVKGANK